MAGGRDRLTLKTAETLGQTIPEQVLRLQVNEVIQ
jgi:hypothetical protein